MNNKKYIKYLTNWIAPLTISSGIFIISYQYGKDWINNEPFLNLDQLMHNCETTFTNSSLTYPTNATLNNECILSNRYNLLGKSISSVARIMLSTFSSIYCLIPVKKQIQTPIIHKLLVDFLCIIFGFTQDSLTYLVLSIQRFIYSLIAFIQNTIITRRTNKQQNQTNDLPQIETNCTKVLKKTSFGKIQNIEYLASSTILFSIISASLISFSKIENKNPIIYFFIPNANINIISIIKNASLSISSVFGIMIPLKNLIAITQNTFCQKNHGINLKNNLYYWLSYFPYLLFAALSNNYIMLCSAITGYCFTQIGIILLQFESAISNVVQYFTNNKNQTNNLEPSETNNFIPKNYPENTKPNNDDQNPQTQIIFSKNEKLQTLNNHPEI